MKEEQGNPLTCTCDALCIPVNGFVSARGTNAIEHGLASAIAEAVPQVPKLIGDHITTHGHYTHIVDVPGRAKLVAFPIKHMFEIKDDHADQPGNFNRGDHIPGYECKARISLILHSAHQLVELADVNKWTRVVMPRMACEGDHPLHWIQVKTILDGILDDRFVVMHND